jgi:NAD+ kinase
MSVHNRLREQSSLRPEKVRLAKPRRIGFVVKHHHPAANDLALELAQLALKRGVQVIFADESEPLRAALLARESGRAVDKRVRMVPKPDLVSHADVIVVLGGDGTFLSIARLMRTRSVPVMGINMGQLGFLTEIKRSEAFDSFNSLLRGKPVLQSERALLEVTLTRRKKVVFQGPVVNDAVISKGAIARIIGMEILLNGRASHTVRADGIIISTPTGSTAYSLAAGGPIVEPCLDALILTPICAHSLTQRPLVVADSTPIQVRLQDRPGHVLLTLDGQDAVDMREGDIVSIRRFKKHSLKLISSSSRDYFTLLREKLKFGLRD